MTTKTTDFVVPAPGHYGDVARVVSSHHPAPRRAQGRGPRLRRARRREDQGRSLGPRGRAGLPACLSNPSAPWSPAVLPEQRRDLAHRVALVPSVSRARSWTRGPRAGEPLGRLILDTALRPRDDDTPRGGRCGDGTGRQTLAGLALYGRSAAAAERHGADDEFAFVRSAVRLGMPSR